MKYFLTTLIFLLFTQFAFTQSFQEQIAKAEAAYDAKNYLESAKAYEMALERKDEKGTAGDYYNAACSWALAGDKEKGLYFLKISADRGWRNFDWMHQDKDLESLQTAPQWTAIADKVQANLDEYEKDFDRPLKEKLEKIYVEDQALRRLIGPAEETFGKDSEEMQYFWRLIQQQDSVNEAKVVQIIEERGWVGSNIVGGKANAALWLIIQHAPLETQEKYLPLLKESVLKGESSGSHLALLEDRIQMRNGKPQIYGSQIVTDPDSGEMMIHEIVDPEYVNQRRKEVGLGPLEDYVKRWGLEWTVPQKER